jgi:hypothetical protein
MSRSDSVSRAADGVIVADLSPGIVQPSRAVDGFHQDLTPRVSSPTYDFGASPILVSNS